MKTNKLPTRRETICLALAIRDAYLGFDSEDYCEKGIGKLSSMKHQCFGCYQYENLRKAYKIAKKLLPIIYDK